ncbi:hypothetical protein [Vibrio sp. MA64]|uniref:hypothetical protein n=1 Tax=Vibrio sp. MA64 TaxID=2896365 RepID=UPI001E40EFBC|nr:hypothetical protein [Vibrio sp. MA64]MCC9651539.1 hypothetical protein [Vibrio sp. MA64]
MRNEIIKLADVGLKLQHELGNMPSGKNGPHKHEMTPVRNTSHWLVTFSAAYYLTKKNEYKLAAGKCLTMIALFSVTDGAYSIHRFSKYGSAGNGLIGQMWVVEALLLSDYFLGCNKSAPVAKRILEQHTFCNKDRLWFESSYEKASKIPNNTLNQQIWVAGMWGLYSFVSGDAMNENVNKFVDGLLSSDNLKDGFFPLEAYQFGIVNKFRRAIFKIKNKLTNGLKRKDKKQILDKEVGYHSFCLVGLGYLALGGFRFNKEQKEIIKRKVDEIDDKYESLVISSPYGSKYNVCGIEVCFFKSILPDVFQEKSSEVGERLFKNDVSMMFEYKNDGYDHETHTARYYELTRMLLTN